MMHLGLIGYGAIARAMTPHLSNCGVERLSVLCKPGRENAAQAIVEGFDGPAQVFADTAALIRATPDLVIEAAGQTALAENAPTCLEAGIEVVAASVGALADDTLLQTLKSAAHSGGARLLLPAGAIGGIDALAALASAGPVELEYTGTKPPSAWPKGAPTDGVVFEGSARAAAHRFPKNANVAAILGLAGPGLDATRVRLVADPKATGNTHAWRATSPSGTIDMVLQNAPVAGNAATSALTVHSLLRAVRNSTFAVAI